MKKKQKFKSLILKFLTKKKQNDFNIKLSKKVLMLRYDRIGDMVVTTPLFRELKSSYPNIKISVLASNENKDVIKHNPFIHKIYTNYKNSILKDLPTLLSLRKQAFDVCIELEHSVIPHAILRLKIIKPKKIISIYKDGRYGVKGSELKLYDYFTNEDKKNHFGKIWLGTLIFFGISHVSNKYDFFLSKIEKDRAINFSSTLGDAIKIGVNLEGSFKEMRIQEYQLKQICMGLHAINKKIKIVILSNPKKNSQVKEIINKFQLKFVFASYITHTINDVAALIEQLDLIITPDTSIVHIAGAFDKPVISIHENNKDSFRLWAPISSLSHTVFAKSDYGIFDYSVDEIIQSTKKMLSKMELDL
jgi:ADP-heptose:LPS heptosyltransferase